MAKRKTTLKKNRDSKKACKKAIVTAGIVIALGSAEVYAKPQFLFGLYPEISLPFSIGSTPLGNQPPEGSIPFGVGGTGKFIFRPVPMVDVFAEGSYNNYSYPYLRDGKSLDYYSFNTFTAAGGAGYNLPLSDRVSLNASVKAGVTFVEKDPVLSVGASVGVSYRVRPSVSVGVEADASFAGPKIIPVGVRPGIIVNLTEVLSKQTNVSVEVLERQPVFPVLYSWYENNPFGSVRIANLEDGSITNVKVSFYQPQYMTQPNLCAEMDVLGKEEYFDCDLTAFFNERMLELTELTETKAVINVEYTFLGEKRKKEFPVNIPVYDRNSMNWADDRRAASFVSSKDPAAMWFAKYVTSVIRDNIRSGVPENIQYAMGIFETLDEFGLNYVIDPSSAYSDNVGGESIDFLQFPYQTLMFRGGDCDDLSILICSLFEAVGIKTSFITVPGHIFMAFDTGLTEEQARNQFSDISQVIFYNGKVWMPLEVTITDEGFNKAWRVGARQWNTAFLQNTAAIYPMEESWKVYRPVSVPGADARFDMPDQRIVAKLFEHRIDEWVLREITPSVNAYKNALAKKYDKGLKNNLGVLYSRYGLFSEAENEFKDLRKVGYLPAVINTANIYFARQSYNKALASYKAVLREDPANELAVLGIARSAWELGDYRESDKYYEMLLSMNPKLAAEYKYLASFEETKGRAFSMADRLNNMTWAVEKEMVQNVLPNSKVDFDSDLILELPPLDLNDENRFEFDYLAEPVKRNVKEEVIKELEEEEEAKKKLAEEPKADYDDELPDFIFRDLKSLEPDFLYEEIAEEDDFDEDKTGLDGFDAEKAVVEKTVEKDTATFIQDKTVSEDKKEFSDLPITSENVVVKRDVPRFNESPSAKWAPEEAFNAESIPGMKSFDEEMGNTQNEKSFLFKNEEYDDDNTENFDIFADKNQKPVLVKEDSETTVNPFESYYGEEPLRKPETSVKVVETQEKVSETSTKPEVAGKTETSAKVAETLAKPETSVKVVETSAKPETSVKTAEISTNLENTTKIESIEKNVQTSAKSETSAKVAEISSKLEITEKPAETSIKPETTEKDVVIPTKPESVVKSEIVEKPAVPVKSETPAKPAEIPTKSEAPAKTETPAKPAEIPTKSETPAKTVQPPAKPEVATKTEITAKPAETPIKPETSAKVVETPAKPETVEISDSQADNAEPIKAPEPVKTEQIIVESQNPVNKGIIALVGGAAGTGLLALGIMINKKRKETTPNEEER